MRLHGKTAVIDNGFVHIPETAPWLAEYLHELTVFANGKHDDQADSAAQFPGLVQKAFPWQGLYEYYRRRAQQLEEQRELLGPLPYPGSRKTSARYDTS